MDSSSPKTRVKRPYMSKIAQTVLVVAVFAVGYVLGNGNLQANKNQLSTSGGQLDYASVEEVYATLQKDFDGQISDEQALDGLKSGLAKATDDPYTEYFNAEDSQDFEDQIDGSFEGIGAELGKDKELIVIISPLSGYPAEKAGLRSGDAIIKIDDSPAFDLTVSEAVKKIRGPAGTQVKLTILRSGTQQIEVNITRVQISVPSVEWTAEDGLGIVKISRFGPDTASLSAKAANELTNQKVKGIILDLRGNPGGYLDASVDVAGLWLASGQKVVEERRGDTVIATKEATGKAPLAKLPTVVLINEGSASASEIVAGALRDNGLAVLVGTKTFGKGSVQQIQNLKGGGLLKITFARWYTPKGQNIDKEGIKPDHEIKPSDEDLAAKRDPAKIKALEILKQKIQ